MPKLNSKFVKQLEKSDDSNLCTLYVKGDWNDADYIDIDSKLIGKENTFSCNTFARSKYHDVFLSLNDIIHNAKVLVNSIENFTK